MQSMKESDSGVNADEGRVRLAYYGSDAAVTRRLLKDLEAVEPSGNVAAWLFRAQKASRRAKTYRGGVWAGGRLCRYRDLSYERKSKAMSRLVGLLEGSAMKWGWGKDDGCCADNVLYVEIPTGQVSFHSFGRYGGPDYAGALPSLVPGSILFGLLESRSFDRGGRHVATPRWPSL